MVVNLTAAAARRVLHCRGAFPRPHYSGSPIILLENNSTTRHRPVATSFMHRNSSFCRSFSSESTEPSVSSQTEGAFFDMNSCGNSVKSPPSETNPRNSNEVKPSTVEKIALDIIMSPLTEEEYDPDEIVSQIFMAAKWNQGQMAGKSKGNNYNTKHNGKKWDYKFVRSTIDKYELHLRFVLDRLKSNNGNRQPLKIETSSSDLLSNIHPSAEKCAATHKLLSPKTLANAIRSLTRSKMDTPLLSKRIREIERLVGLIGWTSITEELSYRLLEANGKAGNVTRTLALLELRKRRGYAPREQDDRTFSVVNKAGILKLVDDDDAARNETTSKIPIERGEKEFIHAITAIQSAQLPLRRSRNLYLHESSFAESALDNPTRYLDAILLNMSQRGVPLRPEMATQMLACYASTGRTGRALHYFYKVIRDPMEDDGFYIPRSAPNAFKQSRVGGVEVGKETGGNRKTRGFRR